MSLVRLPAVRMKLRAVVITSIAVLTRAFQGMTTGMTAISTEIGTGGTTETEIGIGTATATGGATTTTAVAAVTHVRAHLRIGGDRGRLRATTTVPVLANVTTKGAGTASRGMTIRDGGTLMRRRNLPSRRRRTRRTRIR